MNSELCKQALVKVGDANTLINLVSRRVRQLNSGGGGLSRPLVLGTVNMSTADIALREIIEDKIVAEMPDAVALVVAAPKKRRRS